MSNDWIDDPDVSFDEKLAHAEQFREVEVRTSMFVVNAPADTFGSSVIAAPDLDISFGSGALRESITSTSDKTLTSA